MCWKDYFKTFKHRLESLQYRFRNFQILRRVQRIQKWYRNSKTGLTNVYNICKHLQKYIFEKKVITVQALVRGKITRRAIAEDIAYRGCYECLKPKLATEIVRKYFEFETIWKNRKYYRSIQLPVMCIEIPYRIDIMETRRQDSIEGALIVESHRNLCALKIQCRFRSFAAQKRLLNANRSRSMFVLKNENMSID